MIESTLKKGDTIDEQNALRLLEEVLLLPVFETQGDRRVVTEEGAKVAKAIVKKRLTYNVRWPAYFMDTWKEITMGERKDAG